MQEDRRREQSSSSSSKPEKSGEFTTCSGSDHHIKLYTSTQWLMRAEEPAKRRFLIGILVRCQSLELLQSVHSVLQVTQGAYFTYTRCQVNAGHMVTAPSTHSSSASDAVLLGKEMLNIWEWFANSTDLTKTKYFFGLLASCSSDQLYMLCNLARLLIAREKRDINSLQCKTSKRNVVSKWYFIY